MTSYANRAKNRRVITQQDFTVFQGCLDRMVVAGWVERYAIWSGRGIAIRWTQGGHKVARLLRGIVTDFKLPFEAQTFDEMCHGPAKQEPLREDGIRLAVAAFWRDCMASLDLTRNDFDFRCLMHVLAQFGPAPDERE